VEETVTKKTDTLSSILEDICEASTSCERPLGDSPSEVSSESESENDLSFEELA